MIDYSIEKMEYFAEKRGYDAGVAAGISQGISQGKIIQLVELVQDGLLEADDAAKKAGMTEAEFENYMTPHA